MPVNAEHRILPISNNPLVNFEKHQPTKPKNLDLNFDEINTMLLNDIENKPGEEISVEDDHAAAEEDEETETETETESDEEEAGELAPRNPAYAPPGQGANTLGVGDSSQPMLNIISPPTEMVGTDGEEESSPSPDLSPTVGSP